MPKRCVVSLAGCVLGAALRRCPQLLGALCSGQARRCHIAGAMFGFGRLPVRGARERIRRLCLRLALGVCGGLAEINYSQTERIRIRTEPTRVGGDGARVDLFAFARRGTALALLAAGQPNAWAMREWASSAARRRRC